MNQDNEESVVTHKEMEENEHKDNKEEGNQSEEISEEKNELEKEEAREIEKDDRESEEINQSKIEAKENELKNHKQDNKEDRSATENEREEKDEIQVMDSSKNSIKDQDKKRNNIEEAKDTEVAHLHQNKIVLNVTITNQGNASENQIEQEQEHHNTPSSDVETFHLQNEIDTTSNTIEKQFEISKKSNIENSNLHNTTLKMNFSNIDVAIKHVNSTLTNSSEAHERNVLDGQYNGKANANDNIHDGPTNASDTSILEDTSSKNKDDVGQVENENIDTRENEDGTQNELVESQTEKENSKQH
ncbi:hypothetical protein Fmac_002279 [Flemingia macrophylla]|uniref:Uncharacterized protein n=1 Tax=Flemingia macrophylla TaxID=520843 RepID=A0ABD1NJG7_9FABA